MASTLTQNTAQLAAEDKDREALIDIQASAAGLYRRYSRASRRRASRSQKAGGASAQAGLRTMPETAVAVNDDDDESGDMEVPADAPIMQRRLSVSVRRGELNEKRAVQAVRWVDKEIRKLIASIQELGKRNGSGQTEITFGELFVATQNRFEALTGTLRTAKKRKV